MVALSELFILYRPSQHNEGGKNQQLGPRRVITEQVRNKKHHANPPLQEIELETCVSFRMSTLEETGVAQFRTAKLCNFPGVNIENTFRKALICDIPVKKVSAQFQNTPRTRNGTGHKIIK